MKKQILMIAISAMVALTACGPKESAETASGEISNSLFTITLPAECDGTYEADVKDQQITIYHKESKDAGYGGMAFTVWAREMPNEYAGGPYVKKGEIQDSKGNKYEVVLGYATEVQWNYEQSEQAPQSYEALYDAAESVVENMTGVDGATFEYGAGTKGEDIYGDIVEKYKTAAAEGWDASDYEENEMSPEIFILAQDGDLSDIGIAYYDVNLDGIDEMLVGTLKDDELKGAIYDIYTTVDMVPTHVISGSARDRYYVYNKTFLVNEYSGGAMEYGKNVYDLTANSTELFLQWATKYDAYENEDQPWFIGYSDEDWENVTEEDFNNREAATDDYVQLKFKPLSEL